MKTTDITRRLQGLGGAKWDVHMRARKLAAAGQDIIELTIGEPDVATPLALIEQASAAMQGGRTGYSLGRGEPNLRRALAAHYSASSARPISANEVLCFPGTQTALFTTLMGVAQAGDAVLVGDPMYATYEAVIRASGADMIPVPLHAEKGFRMQAADVAARITANTVALLLNTPHNPTGAILQREEITAIGALARKHDLWIISDQVYEDLVFAGAGFHSLLLHDDLRDRVIVVSSISKSHAAPGFRSGWCIAPSAFCDTLLPLSESMLFGNQPFIADMTEVAIREGSSVAPGMRRRYEARAKRLRAKLHEQTGLRVHVPQAGMFALVDVSATGLSGAAYAEDLLATHAVAVMPGSSFGETLHGWVRVALTTADTRFDTGCARMIAHFKGL